MGGLGSYLLVCVVLSFLQLHPSAREQRLHSASTLGKLLLDFFRYYGQAPKSSGHPIASYFMDIFYGIFIVLTDSRGILMPFSLIFHGFLNGCSTGFMYSPQRKPGVPLRDHGYLGAPGRRPLRSTGTWIHHEDEVWGGDAMFGVAGGSQWLGHLDVSILRRSYNMLIC